MIHRLAGCFGALFGICSLLVLTNAQATTSQLPGPFATRSLVTPSGTLRLDAGERWPYYDALFKHELVRDADDREYLNPGVSYGIAPDVELGFVAPIQLAPGTDLADPRIHALYQFDRGQVDAGVFGALRVGLFGEWLLTGGMPVFFHYKDNLRLDTGGFLLMTFGDNSSVSMHAPLQVVFQATENVFLGPELGVHFNNLGDDAFDLTVPIGAFVGYTLRTSGGTLGDLYARVRAPSVEDGVGVVQLMAGLEFYFDM